MKNTTMIILIILSMFSSLLTGCWNYKETNSLRIVTGLALDYNQEEDQYIITIEVIKVIAGEGEETMTGETFECKGSSIFEAIRNMIPKTGRRLYWSESSIAIISEDIARQGIAPVLDVLFRGMEIRSDINILVSQEETAGVIFGFRELKRHKVISYHLENTLQNAERTSRYFTVPVWRFVADLYSDVANPTCPGVKLVEYNGSTFQQIGETAVFKKDKLVGWLNETESRSFLWVTENLNEGVYTMSVREGSSHFKLALEIFSSKTTKKAEIIDDEVVVKINIDSTVNISELSGEYDFSIPENKEALQSIVEKKIKTEIQSLIQSVQKEYNSDILGLGMTIKKDMPKVWKNQIKPNWEVIFPKLKTIVEVTINIRGSATIRKPIEIYD